MLPLDFTPTCHQFCSSGEGSIETSLRREETLEVFSLPQGQGEDGGGAVGGGNGNVTVPHPGPPVCGSKTRVSFSLSLVSLIRGQVVTTDGTPLVGVNVSFVKYPKYGYTITRQDGT